MGGGRRKFNREFKIEAVRMVLEKGRRISEVSRDLDLRPDMLRRWQRELEVDQQQAFPGQGSSKRMRRRCGAFGVS